MPGAEALQAGQQPRELPFDPPEDWFKAAELQDRVTAILKAAKKLAGIIKSSEAEDFSVEAVLLAALLLQKSEKKG